MGKAATKARRTGKVEVRIGEGGGIEPEQALNWNWENDKLLEGGLTIRPALIIYFILFSNNAIP